MPQTNAGPLQHLRDTSFGCDIVYLAPHAHAGPANLRDRCRYRTDPTAMHVVSHSDETGARGRWISLFTKRVCRTGLRARLNARQVKVLQRLLREGPEGFHGVVSAGNYSALMGRPRPRRRAIWRKWWLWVLFGAHRRTPPYRQSPGDFAVRAPRRLMFFAGKAD